MEIREIHRSNQEQAAQWDRFILEETQGSPFETTRYRSVLESTYRLQSFYLGAWENRNLIGTLPLFLCPTFPNGKNLVSLPYTGSYGALRAPSKEVAVALTQSAIQLTQKLDTKVLEIREAAGALNSIPRLLSDTSFAYYSLNLSEGEEKVWAQKLDTKSRNQVRKAEKNNLQWKIGKHNYLNIFYEIYSQTMHRLGSPAHSYDFFDKLLRTFSAETHIATVEIQSKPIAALWLITHNKIVMNPWAGSLRKYSSLCPNNLNYWKSIAWACQQGFKRFDFGRSLKNSPQAKFKSQWGTETQDLEHYFFLSKTNHIPQMNPANPVIRFLQTSWRRIPRFAIHSFESHLAKRVP